MKPDALIIIQLKKAIREAITDLHIAPTYDPPNTALVNPKVVSARRTLENAIDATK